MGRKNCFIVRGAAIDKYELKSNPLLEINGQLNTDCRSGLLYEDTEKCVTIRSGDIGPNGYLAPHRTNGIAYVIAMSGFGKIGITDDEGKDMCEINIEAGDEVVFEKPMQLHYYKAGEQGLSYRMVGF